MFNELDKRYVILLPLIICKPSTSSLSLRMTYLDMPPYKRSVSIDLKTDLAELILKYWSE